MKNKRNRLQIISEILRSNVVGSQEELLKILTERQCEVTQATLSRDLKLLKVAKTPLSNGTYKYILPSYNKPLPSQPTANALISHGAVLSLEFSGQLAVVKPNLDMPAPLPGISTTKQPMKCSVPLRETTQFL